MMSMDFLEYFLPMSICWGIIITNTKIDDDDSGGGVIVFIASFIPVLNIMIIIAYVSALIFEILGRFKK